MSFFKSLAGPGYVILNVVRVMNIIVLLAVAAACAVMLAKTTLSSNFFVFGAATHAVYAFICCEFARLCCEIKMCFFLYAFWLTRLVTVFLIITELNIFRGYFSRNWPLFSQDAGLITLGATMIFLGVATLGNLNNKSLSEDEIGGSFWRIILAGGIVAIIFGVINIVLVCLSYRLLLSCN